MNGALSLSKNFPQLPCPRIIRCFAAINKKIYCLTKEKKFPRVGVIFLSYGEIARAREAVFRCNDFSFSLTGAAMGKSFVVAKNLVYLPLEKGIIRIFAAINSKIGK